MQPINIPKLQSDIDKDITSYIQFVIQDLISTHGQHQDVIALMKAVNVGLFRVASFSYMEAYHSIGKCEDISVCITELVQDFTEAFLECHQAMHRSDRGHEN